MTAIAAVSVVLLMIAAVGLFGVSISLVYSLISGLVVGALARLVLPGEEKIGWLGTALIGMAGGVGGNVIGNALHLGQVLQLGVSVALAAGLLTALGYRANR